MKDIDKAREIANRMAGEIGLEITTLEQTQRLLDGYEKQREELFGKMVELLSKADTSDLLSEWKDFCDRGKEELRKLNDISPGNGMGVTMVGLAPFQSGELKIWDQNSRAEMARAAVDLKLIYFANSRVVEVCDDELKAFFSEKKALVDLAEGRFGAIKDIAGKMKDFILAFRKLKNYVGEQTPADQLTSLGTALAGHYTAVKEAASKKQALVLVLVGRLNMIKEAQSKLDLAAIADAYRTGEAVATSLQGVGRDSPYDAEDWSDFGKDCIEKLRDARELAETKSKAVFEDLVNTLREETTKGIEALTDDPAEQERWNDDLTASFDSMQEAIDQEQDFLATIVEGPGRQAIASTWVVIKAMKDVYLDGWKTLYNSIRGK